MSAEAQSSRPPERDLIGSIFLVVAQIIFGVTGFGLTILSSLGIAGCSSTRSCNLTLIHALTWVPIVAGGAIVVASVALLITRQIQHRQAWRPLMIGAAVLAVVMLAAPAIINLETS
jgi:uncharacterized BrkB/YihY/UPF0761 family membrane protein